MGETPMPRTSMRRSATNPGVSLFPFLAVLICTMGVMMLLLIVMNRPGVEGEGDGPGGDDPNPGGAPTASSGATGQRSRPVSAADIQETHDTLAWRIAQLQTSREKTGAELADRRLRLSATETTMRTLRDQWKSLSAAATDLEQTEHGKDADHQSSAKQLAELKEQIDRTKFAAAKTEEKVRKESPYFAIVPYDGPNGTRRRPIYIECRPDAVVLQPEGIALGEQDFAGPQGPGNPLASTLRAVRDYLASGPGAGQGEPYPLLIVRPNGIAGFYFAREAMSSWASEFGYELIEQHQKLAYPPPDPQLARVEATALADARSRYAWYAQTSTARKEAEAASGSRPAYRASVTGGGIVREGGARLASDGDGDGDGSSGSGFPHLGSGNGTGGNGGNVAGTLGGPSAGQSGEIPGGYLNGTGPGGGAPGGNGYGNGTGAGGAAVGAPIGVVAGNGFGGGFGGGPNGGPGGSGPSGFGGGIGPGGAGFGPGGNGPSGDGHGGVFPNGVAGGGGNGNGLVAQPADLFGGGGPTNARFASANGGAGYGGTNNGGTNYGGPGTGNPSNGAIGPGGNGGIAGGTNVAGGPSSGGAYNGTPTGGAFAGGAPGGPSGTTPGGSYASDGGTSGPGGFGPSGGGAGGGRQQGRRRNRRWRWRTAAELVAAELVAAAGRWWRWR